MKNKIIRFSIVTAACLVIWAVTTFFHFKNATISDFLGGFASGVGIVTAIGLIYNIVIALQRKDSTTTIS